MCRGRVLLITEVKRAAELRKCFTNKRRLSWRKIGAILGRDHTGLNRAVKKLGEQHV